VSWEEASGGELSPETLRLVARVAAGLGLAAGALAVVAFVLGIVREGETRWIVLALGGVMLALPLVVSRLVRGAR
jgi:hypothetical protein